MRQIQTPSFKAAADNHAPQPYEHTPAHKAALDRINSRINKRAYQKWMRENNWDDDTYDPYDPLEAYLKDEFQIEVTPEGDVEFWDMNSSVRRLIGDLPVIVWHHSSDAIAPTVAREGLRRITRGVNRHMNSSSGVYVTTLGSGKDVDQYHAMAVRGHGGNPFSYQIRTTFDQLTPDPDDADIYSGRFQYVMASVPPQQILNLQEALESNERGIGREPEPGFYDRDEGEEQEDDKPYDPYALDDPFSDGYGDDDPDIDDRRW
jgi:hypothetical protein